MTTVALFVRGCGWDSGVTEGGGRYFIVGDVRKEYMPVWMMRVYAKC